jgi:2-keto-3-deoxy-L-rhamnonate aldolase RhmA
MVCRKIADTIRARWRMSSVMSVRVNHWVIEQVLSAGVHGLMLCHARNPDAVKMFVASARYQFERPELKAADRVIPEGLRGSGIMVTHGTSVELTNKGGALTKRQMPY